MIRTIAILAVISSVSLVAQEITTVEDLAFLAGKWVGRDGEVYFEEQWSEPVGNSMTGMFRVVTSKKPELYEFLVIEQERNGPVLRFKHVAPGAGLVTREPRDRSINLPLVSLRGTEAIFEGTNLGKRLRIIYRREGDSLYGAVERQEGGKPVKEEFRYERAGSATGESSIERFSDSLLDQMVGSWKLTGTILNEPAEQSVEAQWVLNHQFLQIHFTDLGVPREYEAIVYIGFDHRSERYVAHWLDTFGGRVSETLGYGTRDGNSIRFVFEYPDGPFHNTFTWDPENRAWTFRLRTKNERGEWTTFAEERMIRK